MAAYKYPPTQEPTRSRRRRLALAGVTPLAALALVAGTAPAANAADVGVIVNTENGGNAKVRSAPSTEADVVDVFRNGTRLPDAECRVRTADTSVWVKLAGERYIRADLTGFDRRVPECSVETASPMPRSENGARWGLGNRPADDYSYHHTIQIGDLDPHSLGVSPETVMNDLMADFNTFQFPGCGPKIWPGKECVISVFGLDTPIRIDRTWSTGFEFTSLPGHIEGPGRWITFNFLWNEKGNGLLLDVRAGGPRPTGIVDFHYQGIPVGLFANGEVARGSWATFADKLADKYRLNTLDYYLDSIRP